MPVQGQSYTFQFPAVSSGSPGVKISPVWASGDAKITKPGAAPVNMTNLPTNNGGGNSQVVLTAAEMSIGLTDGQVGEILIEFTNGIMVPLLGVTIEIAFNGPGTLTAAERALQSAAIDAAVADNFAAVLAAIAALPAAPSAAANAAAVDTAVADNFAAVLAAVAAVPASPSAGDVATAVDSAVADNFAAVLAAVAAVPAAPTTSAIAVAVRDVSVDGDRTLGEAAALAAAMPANAGEVPITAAGGVIKFRNAANTADLIVGAISSTGVRTFTVPAP